jgi:cell division protein FtsN
MPAASEDTEITLGTGKMLALFFGLVALCAVFFALGYSLGKKSISSAVSPTPPGTSALRAQPTKPSSANPSSSDMTFYKAVGQKETDTQLSTNTSAAKSSVAGEDAAAQNAQTDDKPRDPMVPPTINGYYVQVAAVSKQEDAEALVEALKGKQYPAFSANIAGDKLFHIQVGPFADIKEAESLRAKLVSDGYNPILKK